jgi:hypothetical protein
MGWYGTDQSPAFELTNVLILDQSGETPDTTNSPITQEH